MDKCAVTGSEKEWELGRKTGVFRGKRSHDYAGGLDAAGVSQAWNRGEMGEDGMKESIRL